MFFCGSKETPLGIGIDLRRQIGKAKFPSDLWRPLGRLERNSHLGKSLFYFRPLLSPLLKRHFCSI